MTKGYLLLAHGREGKYYEFAANLAASIKGTGAEMPIALLTDNPKPPLSKAHLALFDQIITLKKEDYLGRKQAIPFYTKTLLYKRSPFDATIYLDADGWAINNPDSLFNDLKGTSFQPQCVGVWGFSDCNKSKIIWSNPQKLYKLYGFDHSRPFVEHNSSFLYFEKGDIAEDIFSLAEYFYSTEFVKAYKHEGFYHYPDELAFSVATMAANYRPFVYAPIWFKTRIGWDWEQYKRVRKNRYFVGLYGGTGYSNPLVWKAYFKELYANHSSKKLPEPFKLTEREKIASKSGSNPRYKGLKPFTERPDDITAIIDKYG